MKSRYILIIATAIILSSCSHRNSLDIPEGLFVLQAVYYEQELLDSVDIGNLFYYIDKKEYKLILGYYEDYGIQETGYIEIKRGQMQLCSARIPGRKSPMLFYGNKFTIFGYPSRLIEIFKKVDDPILIENILSSIE